MSPYREHEPEGKVVYKMSKKTMVLVSSFISFPSSAACAFGAVRYPEEVTRIFFISSCLGFFILTVALVWGWFYIMFFGKDLPCPAFTDETHATDEGEPSEPFLAW